MIQYCKGKIAPRSPAPSPDEFNLLAGQYPDSGFAWKLLQMEGKETLSADQIAVMLVPDDVQAYLNPGMARQNLVHSQWLHFRVKSAFTFYQDKP